MQRRARFKTDVFRSPALHTSRIHGRRKNTVRGSFGRALGGNRVSMVYTQALVFGIGRSARKLAEEERSFGSERETLRHGEGRLWKARSTISLGSECSLEEEEPEESSLNLSLSKLIKKCLCDAKAGSLCCQELRLPSHMISRVASDILSCAEDEPCGLRGASIQLFLEIKDTLLKLGIVVPESSLTPTFEISVVLQPDTSAWPSLKVLLAGGKMVSIRREYRLIKRKLYSSATPTILQFE